MSEAEDPKHYFHIEPAVVFGEEPGVRWRCAVYEHAWVRPKGKPKALINLIASTPERALADAMMWLEAGKPAIGERIILPDAEGVQEENGVITE